MKIEDYIIVKNTIPKNICKLIVDECNTKPWVKHQWNNYTTGKNTSEQKKELDIMFSTKSQKDKLKLPVAKALDEYQKLCSWDGEKTGSTWLTSYSTIRFNKYEVGTMMRKHYDHIHDIFDGKRKGVASTNNLSDESIKLTIEKSKNQACSIFGSCLIKNIVNMIVLVPY